MNKISMLVLAAAFVVPVQAYAAGKHHFKVVDANSGDVLYDDGKLDGKGCAAGSTAVWDPKTQTWTKKPAYKCNF